MNTGMGYDPTNNKPADVQSKGWGSLAVSTYVKVLVIAALLVWFFREEIHRIVYSWKDPSWSHGMLIPLFSLYFLNQRKREVVELKPQPNYLGLVLLVCCFAFYAADVAYLGHYYFQPLTLIAAIGAIVLFLGGWSLIRFTWLPITFLWFAVQLPDRLYKQITIPMRILAAKIAAVLLGWVNSMEAQANGAVIDVTYRGTPLDPPLDVAEACSGMRLLMAFVALGVAMAYLHERPMWQRMVLLVSTVPIAILCNVIRVTVTGFIYVLWDPQYAQGVYHDMLGMMMLPLAFGLYGALAWFMSNLFEEDTALVEEDLIIRRND